MIDWTEELLTQIEAFSRVALSYPGIDGYPVVLPLPLAFDRDKRFFTLPIPHQRPVPASKEQVSLTLLRYDEQIDRKSTRLNSSHLVTSYAVFCLNKNIYSQQAY